MLINTSKTGAYRVVPDSLQWCPAARSNGRKLNHKKFHLNMRKNFCTLRVADHSNRLPRECLSMDVGMFLEETGRVVNEPRKR